MKRRFHPSRAVSLAFTLLCGASGLAMDDAKLVDQLKRTKENFAEAEAERRRLLGSLYAITQRMKVISSRKGRLTDDLFQSQESVKSVAGAINSLEAQIARQRKGLFRRLRAMYKLSGEGYLGAIFSQQSAFDLDSTMRGLKIVSDYDYQTIRSYSDNVRSLAAQRKKLKAQVERLLTVEKRIRKQEDLLAVEHRAKSNLAATIETKAKQKLVEMQKLRQKAVVTAADVELSDLLKPSVFERKGQLALPLPSGVLVRGFGLVVDPKYRFRTSHKGWSLRAPEPQLGSAPVVAVDDGLVSFRGVLSGYGDVIVLDHRDHYYSVYSGTIDSSLTAGTAVGREQVLGRVKGNLYFEIRHFSEPEDPIAWIKAAPRVLTSAKTEDDNSEVRSSDDQHVVME